MSHFLSTKLSALNRNPSAKTLIRSLIFLGIVSYLFYRLSLIGWSEIFDALPDTPLFYLLSLIVFITPIFAEMTAFKLVTGNKIVTPLKVFTRKHVLNKAVLAYSGEAYLVQQLSKSNTLDLKSAAISIKDLALIRTFVANLWVIILIVASLALGHAQVLQQVMLTSPAIAIGLTVMSLLICFLAVVLFKKLSNLPYAVGAEVTAVFLLRSVMVASILTAQWSLAIPGTPLSVWFIFLVVFYLTRKSPVGGEMVFISVALALPGLGADSAEIAAMLVSLMALNQISYFIGFLATSNFTGFNFLPNVDRFAKHTTPLRSEATDCS